jgi:hypothetical protein
VAVRWYLRYGLSYRDVEELLAERGIEVDHVTSIAGCSGSPRCSSTRHDPAGTSLATGDSSTKLISKSPGGGSICTGRLTSSARSLTSSSQRNGI